MTLKLQEAVEMLAEISDRADVMGISLVAYPVPEVREVLAGLRRAKMQSVPATSDGADLEAAREERIREDERDRLYEVHEGFVHGNHAMIADWLRCEGAMLPAARAALRRREDETGFNGGGE